MSSHSVSCTDPREIANEDLIALVRGEAGAEVQRHVAGCPACAAQAGEYAWIERLLLSKLFRHDCPPTTRIGEYVIGLLPGDEVQELAAHLVECPHCRHEQEQFQQFMSQPDIVPADQRMGSALRRLLARPLMPSSALSGLRGGGQGPGSVTYSAEGLRLTVSVQRAARGAPGFVLAGLIELGSEPEPGTRAHLYAGDQLLMTEEIDELGSFMFSGVSTGEYRIEVSIPSAVVVIDPLQVA